MSTPRPLLSMLILAAGLLAGPAPAADDTITLDNGDEIAGRIIAENVEGVSIEVISGQGTIRSTHFIPHASIRSISRVRPMTPEGEGSEERVPGDPGAPAGQPGATDAAPAPLLDVAAALAVLDRAMEQADGLISQGAYDRAIAIYKELATRAEGLQKQNPSKDDTVRVLERLEQGYKRWIIAVEGKQKMLEQEQRVSGEAVRTRLKEAETALRNYEREEARSRSAKERDIRRMSVRDDIALRSATEKERLQADLERAKRQEAEFTAWNAKTTLEIQQLANESELLREKSRQTTTRLRETRRLR